MLVFFQKNEIESEVGDSHDIRESMKDSTYCQDDNVIRFD